ncbi:uncharacterized protein TNCV_2341031 [Trichonephila clavipes]|nr:uncharacterized protein TNCV_2341031 [Trichonephila clavipes]
MGGKATEKYYLQLSQKKSSGVKHTSKFEGQRDDNQKFTKLALNSNNSTSASEAKLSTFDSFHVPEPEFHGSTGNRIINFQALMGIISILCCPECYATGLKLAEDSKEELCSNLCVACSCRFMTGFTSTPKENKKFSLSTLLVFGLRLIGRGFTAGIGIDPTTLKNYMGIDKERIQKSKRQSLPSTKLSRKKKKAKKKSKLAKNEAKEGLSYKYEKCEEWKRPFNTCRSLKAVKRFEETGKLEDRARAGRPCLKEARAPCIAVEMEAIASEAASGTSSAREAARRLGLPPSSVHTAQREAFAKWAFSKMEQDPTWDFNILWTDEAHFSLHGDVNNYNCPIWATSNPREYTQKPLHSPKVTAWCGFTGSFIIGPFFFETQCPVNGWITETVNAQRYLMLLRETVVPCVIQRGQILNVTFMQDGATSHTANPVKAFLIETFGEDRIVSRHHRYPWLPWSLDLTPVDFWLWGYLKSHVYLSGPSSLSELKDAIRREVSSIHPDMLHSAVAGFVTRLECLLPCGGGHVKHILV